MHTMGTPASEWEHVTEHTSVGPSKSTPAKGYGYYRVAPKLGAHDAQARNAMGEGLPAVTGGADGPVRSAPVPPYHAIECSTVACPLGIVAATDLPASRVWRMMYGEGKTMRWIPVLLLLGCAETAGLRGGPGVGSASVNSDAVTSSDEGLEPEPRADVVGVRRLDSDGDGLTDAEEAVIGTDPLQADSDGDTYTDYEEQLEGTDPLDPESRIYTGYWPYHPKKDFIENPGWVQPCPGGMGCECETDADCNTGFCKDFPKADYCSPVPGMIIPRFIGTDQYGETVELYDYAHDGKLIVLDMSTGWCAPCKELANWLLTDNQDITEIPKWKPEYQVIRELVSSGKIHWVTILYENAEHGPADAAIVKAWGEAYPHEGIPVLADAKKELHTWLKPSGIPNLHILGENMGLMTYDNRGIEAAFDLLLEIFPPGGE